ncbi:unnamed protein product [Leptosia nina]|uniref:Uncharacterized protein n=1 Tax=Leptosia nina TaxID=320188 RepID=A0AAV1IVV2_9NEOP
MQAQCELSNTLVGTKRYEIHIALHSRVLGVKRRRIAPKCALCGNERQVECPAFSSSYLVNPFKAPPAGPVDLNGEDTGAVIELGAFGVGRIDVCVRYLRAAWLN